MSFESSSTAVWYVIQTKPKKETEACGNLSGQGYQCFFPKMLDYRIVNGRAVTIEKPLFPNYLFVKLILAHHYYQVKWTEGLSRLVEWRDRPAPIADEVGAIIRNRMNENGEGEDREESSAW